VAAWTEYARPWLETEPQPGREPFAADQVRAQLVHRVRLRFVDGVTPRMRLLLPREHTTLAAAIADGTATAMTVSSAAAFPQEREFRVLIEDEVLLVKAGQGGTTWTVERGADGTTGAAHASGSDVRRLVVLDIDSVRPDQRRAELHIEAMETDG
jgi:hypothetical protein